ncbi:MAG: hypothetical protein COU32_03730 [Candidatus Magasanikbacteria bacterium CG10_big_fil_rev_8_21_14_0_10_42_10]|uniref:Peptidoglycan glycosyltransferase n=2 Tax=Candidatus Magasanikiibacteriota TaxID=1752731 RepID=A0A2H0TVF0_9BACT|nr:MAG: hypothetical protein COU32_03730 [Candidatus Magasanikbacteria bacterium CG10_big_fil_rev_8_21_14_0_10_42_10]PIZ92948.1 MAG: hypothetical protein COX82_03720 [Candidatus Magasanikbacteria bacterium CG_4_10_14_0_2_um_filter_41_10]
MSRKRIRSRNTAVFSHHAEEIAETARLNIAALSIVGFVLLICTRLFFLMVLQHAFYTALAAGSHTLYEQLFPDRGSVYVQDSRTGEEFPLAINKDVFTIFVDTRNIKNEEQATHVVDAFASVFAYTDEQKTDVFSRINGRDDPYEPIEKDVEEKIVDTLKEQDLPGVGFVRHAVRFYPETTLAAQTIGFVGKTDDGSDIGRYGIEGYWQEDLAGSGGFLEASKSLGGGVIPFATKSFKPAKDGSDILLTLDRTVQYKACERMRAAMEEYGATSASLVILDPKTGAIRAMCSLPDFDPNMYSKVEDVRAYNNTTIFTPYEPGSIFKPMAMAAALNEEDVTPDTYFYDSGSVDANCTKPIKNANDKVYKDSTMTGVLENSINTGMVFVVTKLGKHPFMSYLESFGFGVKSGVRLDSEISGTIDSLYVNKNDTIDCYTATASFGQGITVTPLQMVSALSAIANNGTMMKPYIVQEVRHPDGKIDRTTPTISKKVVSQRAASLLSAMLVRVIDSGQAGAASVPGYYIAGKTGTAQIAGPGGYSDETNHSFIGFGPVDDPKFVMIVKFEKPQRAYSVSTAAPVFSDIASFLMDYYHIPPGK